MGNACSSKPVTPSAPRHGPPQPFSNRSSEASKDMNHRPSHGHVSKSTPGLMQQAPTSAYLPNLKMRRIDEMPSDMSTDSASKAALYKPPGGGKSNYLDFSPEVALILAVACGLHQLPKYELMKDKGLRGVSGMDAVLTYIEASDETIWPTERIKNGVISFTNGKLAGSVMTMEQGGQKVLVIVFGSPVEEGSAAAVADALRPRHTGKHPSVDGAVIQHVAQQWGQVDQGLLDLVKRLRDGPEKFGHIFVAGHGLGASLAVMAAATLKIDGSLSASDLTVYTFGAPMCCDARFTDTYDVLLKHTWRVALAADLVPSMTPGDPAPGHEPAPVCHVGKWVHLDRKGAWVCRGSPAVLTQAGLEERQRNSGGEWAGAHTARAYCEALQKVCAVHGQDSAKVSDLLASL